MTNTLRKALSVAGATLIAAGSLLAFPTAANATSQTIVVDCTSGEEFYSVQVDLTDTVTISTVNCVDGLDDWTTYDSGFYNTVLSSVTTDVPNNDPIIFTAPNPRNASFVDELRFENNGVFTDLDIYVYGNEDNPGGTLLDTTTINLTKSGADALDYSTVDVGQVHTIGGGNDSDCYVIAGVHPYGTVTATISQAGDYTFRVVDTSSNEAMVDPVIVIFDNFDPASPDSGVVGCAAEGRSVGAYSDAGDLMYSSYGLLEISLEPGTYTFMAVTRSTFDDWTAATEGITPSTTLEAWGPAGGITFNDGLAETGVQSFGPMNVLGLGLLAAGIVFIAARRRRAAV